jgi:hypothetical protein
VAQDEEMTVEQRLEKIEKRLKDLENNQAINARHESYRFGVQTAALLELIIVLINQRVLEREALVTAYDQLSTKLMADNNPVGFQLADLIRGSAVGTDRKSSAG